jgi:putative aminopeptidase FrvX
LTDKVLDTLKALCAIPGPVGREEMVQEFMRDHLRNYCDSLESDKIGNLIASIDGTGEHYALVAHADEVGFYVSNIDENGFIRAKWSTQAYMPDLRLLPGQWILFMTEKGMVPGCFCVQTAHIAGQKGKNKLPCWEEIFIDVGVSSAEKVNDLGIQIGTPVIYAAPTEEVGSHLMGKSFDDRAGLTAMIMIAEQLSKLPKEKRPNVTLLSTVMEEIGAKGASASARDLDVDAVIVLEVGLADDYPGTHGEASVCLGKGPVVVVKDSQLVYSHATNKRVFEVAEKRSIEIQRAVYHNYATDGFPIAAQGQPVSTIGIPCRYTHSSFECIDPVDLVKTIDLVFHFLVSG